MIQDPFQDKNRSEALIDQCIVVIRSAGERTTAWALAKANAIFDEGNVMVMDERPMHKAIKRTFEMGMDGGKPWIVEIDADVLLHESGILQLLRTASQRPENSFFHFGMVFDKLTNSFRSAGNKIIRTAHIPEAMSLLPKTTDQLRPDTYIRKEMALKGYHYYRDICLVGIHDFEQDYFDLYRKGYLQGVKNREKLERFIRGWPENWGNDPDYLAIKGGMTAGKAHENDLPLAPSYYIDKFENWKMSIGFDFTKVPLASGLSKVDHYLSTILTNSKLQEFQDSCVNNQAKYHVRSDVNWQYKWMKLRYRLSQSRIFTGFSLSQKHSN